MIEKNLWGLQSRNFEKVLRTTGLERVKGGGKSMRDVRYRTNKERG